MRCIFCEGEDVHECPGGTYLDAGPEDPEPFTFHASGIAVVFPGKLDARAFQPPRYKLIEATSPARVAFWYELFPHRFA